jgi:hypothetical protein
MSYECVFNCGIKISDVITLISAIVASGLSAVAVVWAANQQFKQNLKIQEANYKKKLNAEFYKKISKQLYLIQNSQVDCSSYIRSIIGSFENNFNQITSGYNPNPIKQRYVELSDIHNKCLKNVYEALFLLESYEIISPIKFNLAKTGLNVYQFNFANYFHELIMELINVLPMDIIKDGKEEIVNIKYLNKNEIENFKNKCEKYLDYSDDLSDCASDLIIAFQNLLLKDLYNENIVSTRKPLDSKYIPLSFEEDKIEYLIKYYNESTNWGKYKKEIETEVLNNLNKNNKI